MLLLYIRSRSHLITVHTLLTAVSLLQDVFCTYRPRSGDISCMTNDACWGGEKKVFQIITKIQNSIFKLFKNLKQYKYDAIPVLLMIYKNMYNVWYSTQHTGYKTTVYGFGICSFVSALINMHITQQGRKKKRDREEKGKGNFNIKAICTTEIVMAEHSAVDSAFRRMHRHSNARTGLNTPSPRYCTAYHTSPPLDPVVHHIHH